MAHENIEENIEVKNGSERWIYENTYLLKESAIRAWAAVVATIFAAAAVLAPTTLKPLNILWFKFGLLLHRIVTPVIMGVIFVLTVIPTALAMRLAGKDPLSLKFDRGADSYWVARDGAEKNSMNNQF